MCVRTLEEVVVQAAMVHELVDEEPVLLLAAVADHPHQAGMPQLQLPEEHRLLLITR